MFARQVVRSLNPATQLVQSRGHSVIAGPPQVKVSFAEKAVHGVIMLSGWLTIPAWVLCHMKDYKGTK